MRAAEHRVLVTGATGFVGRRLIGRLTAMEGVQVTAVGRRPCDQASVRNIIVGDPVPASIVEAVRGLSVDTVIHLAAAGVHPADREPGTLLSINAWLPAQLVLAASACGASAFVLGGSSAEYQACATAVPIDERQPLEHRKLYGASKAAGGLLALAVAEQLGLPAANLRIFNAFGPGEAPHRLLPSLVDQLAQGRPVRLSPGTQVRDFIHVDDVCGGLWAAALALRRGRLAPGPYNLCSGQGRSVAIFAKVVARMMHVPETLLEFGALPMRPDDTPYLVGNPHAFHSQTGWEPTLQFEAGLKHAVEQSIRPVQAC